MMNETNRLGFRCEGIMQDVVILQFFGDRYGCKLGHDNSDYRKWNVSLSSRAFFDSLSYRQAYVLTHRCND